MKQRKKKIINSKFQILSSFKLAFISIVPIALILGIVLFFTYDSENKIAKNLENLREAIKTEDNIIQAYLEVARVYKDKNLRLAANNVRSDHEKSIKVIKEYIPEIVNQMRYYYYFIYILGAILILHAIFVFRYIIRFTHRISGPVHIIHKAIKSMLDDLPFENRRLRKNDAFKDLYDDVLKLCKKYYHLH